MKNCNWRSKLKKNFYKRSKKNKEIKGIKIELENKKYEKPKLKINKTFIKKNQEKNYKSKE
jgi:hypothetical protein